MILAEGAQRRVLAEGAQRMILGIDASNLGPGGSMTHLTNLLAVARPAEHGIERVVVWGGSAKLARLPEQPWLEKVAVPALDGGLVSRLLWQRFRLPALARERCDVLFVPGGNARPGGFHPLVTMSRNMLPFEWDELRRYGHSRVALRLLLLRFGQSRTFAHADGLIFLTDYARGAVGRVSRLPARVGVIPHGVEERFRIAPREQRPLAEYSTERPLRMLYVSIIDLYKHQWHVARAVHQLRTAGLPIRIDFVGPAYPPALASFQATLQKLDPQSSFLRYLGSVPFPKLHELYRDADLFVFASSCENMPNVLLEGMAAGLPIACSNRGPMPEVLGDTGLCFDPERVDDIARALRTLAEDPALRRRLAVAASERARQFSWQRCAQETLSFIARTGAETRPAAQRPALSSR
jgi:glycosyltransferase involved in cell wall biosynthesis